MISNLFLVLATVAMTCLNGCVGMVTSGGGNPPGGAPAITVGGLLAGQVSSNSAQINWTSNVPGDSQVDYGTTSAYGTSTPLDSTLVTSHSVSLSSLSASTTYHYRAKSKDASRNSAASGDATFTTSAAPDMTPPTISMTAPSNNATVSGTAPVSANATDNIGVASVQFQLDGANLGSADSSSPYSVSWNTATASNGSHSLRAIARDAAGNSATSTAVNVTVSNSTPDTTPPSVPAGLSATAQSSTQIRLTWSASTDNVGVTGYRIFRASVQVGTSASTAFTDSGLAAGTTYSYAVAAYDAAGNISAQSAAASATTSSSSGRVIEIFPSNANTSCNEEFENVANTLQPGDSLILHGGMYTQNCRRSISGINGTASSPITIEAASGETPLITRPSNNENNIEFDAVSYLVVRGLHFQGGDSGVRLMSVNHLTFEDNEIFGTDNNALRANDTNTDSLIIRHNHIHDTGLYTGGPTEGEGMYLGCNNNACHMTNSLIVGNYVHTLRSTSSGGNDGIEVKVGSGNNIIRDNVIHDTNIGVAYPCINAYGGGTAVNIIEGNVGWNCGEGLYIISDAIVRNNIIFNSNTGVSSYPHAQVAQMKNLTIENNTFYNNSECLYLRWSSATNLVLANNAAYCSSGNALNASGIGGATIRKNFVQGGMSGGSVDGTAFVNGGTAATALVNAAGWDFWPLTGSPLRGAADAGFIPTLDFNGTPRTSTYDVGAYETEGLAANPGWHIFAGFKPLTIP